jgi:fucose permease
MGLYTSEDEVVRDMFVLGLGIGVSMTAFNTIAQNAFVRSRIGQVTVATAFFREIGGTIGLAILGSFMTSRFVEQFQQHLPTDLKAANPPAQLAQFENPQLLLSSGVAERIHQGFVAYGPGGEALYRQLMATIQVSLADAVTRCFLIATLLIAVGFVATLFLREIPLRKRQKAGEAA